MCECMHIMHLMKEERTTVNSLKLIIIIIMSQNLYVASKIKTGFGST